MRRSVRRTAGSSPKPIRLSKKRCASSSAADAPVCDAAWNIDLVPIGANRRPKLIPKFCELGLTSLFGRARLGDVGCGNDSADPSGSFGTLRGRGCAQKDCSGFEGIAAHGSQGGAHGRGVIQLRRKVQPMPKLEPWVEELERRLEANEGKARRDRLSLLRIYGVYMLDDVSSSI